MTELTNHRPGESRDMGQLVYIAQCHESVHKGNTILISINVTVFNLLPIISCVLSIIHHGYKGTNTRNLPVNVKMNNRSWLHPWKLNFVL